MKVKVIGVNHYTKNVNGKDYENYRFFFVRKPFISVFSESDIKGLVADSIRVTGDSFKSIKLDKCYELVEARTGVDKDNKPVYGVVDFYEVDNL